MQICFTCTKEAALNYEKLAKAIGISRSALIARALPDFVVTAIRAAQNPSQLRKVMNYALQQKTNYVRTKYYCPAQAAGES
jgi:hypothetical protein